MTHFLERFSRNPQGSGPARRRLVAKRDGVVLLFVLVFVALLILVGYGFFGLMNAEFEAVYAANRVGSARTLADSGLHYAVFVLSYPDSAGISDGEGSLLISPAAVYDNPAVFHMRPVTLSQTASSSAPQGYFSIISPRDPGDSMSESQGFRFGVEDESAKLNLNALLRLDPTGRTIREAMLKVQVQGLTEETVDAFINWMRPVNGGGESAAGDQLYYSSLGYSLKNGLYESLEETLLVRGVTPRKLLGNDRNRNGILEPEEDDAGGVLDPGWARYLTVYSREKNLDAQGQPRIWINDTDLEGLYEKIKAAVGEDLANFIIGYRIYGSPPPPATQAIASGTTFLSWQAFATVRTATTRVGQLKKEDIDFKRNAKNINSLFDLIDAYFEISRPRGGGGFWLGGGGGGVGQQSIRYYSPLQKSKTDALRAQLPILLDKFTTTKDVDLPPRINVNTAAFEVMMAMPGQTEADVQKVIDHQPSPNTDPANATIYRTLAWLVTEAGIDSSKVRQAEPFITTRSQVYRMQIVGYYEQGGPTVRLEAVIDTNYGRPRIVYWRDISELGPGYDFRTLTYRD